MHSKIHHRPGVKAHCYKDQNKLKSIVIKLETFLQMCNIQCHFLFSNITQTKGTTLLSVTAGRNNKSKCLKSK